MNKFIQTHFFHLFTFPIPTKPKGEKIKKNFHPPTFSLLQPNGPEVFDSLRRGSEFKLWGKCGNEYKQ